MTHLQVRAAMAAAVLAGGALATVPGGAAAPRCALADGASHVAIVVRHQDGGGVTRCVPFSGSSITAEAAIKASGLQYAVATYDAATGDELCQVDNEPPTPQGGWTTANCFGDRSQAVYWGVLAWYSDGQWRATRHGISTEAFGPGEALGLTFGNQPAPQPATPVGVCPGVTGRPAATGTTPKPTATPAAATPGPAGPAPLVPPAGGGAASTPVGAGALPLSEASASPATGEVSAATSPQPAVAAGSAGPPGPGARSSTPDWTGIAAAAVLALLMLALLVARVVRTRAKGQGG